MLLLLLRIKIIEMYTSALEDYKIYCFVNYCSKVEISIIIHFLPKNVLLLNERFLHSYETHRKVSR